MIVESPDEAVIERLHRFVLSRLQIEEAVEVELRLEGFHPVSTGRSRDNWVFDAMWHRVGDSTWNLLG
jgi:hypothetical protein